MDDWVVVGEVGDWVVGDWVVVGEVGDWVVTTGSPDVTVVTGTLKYGLVFGSE